MRGWEGGMLRFLSARFAEKHGFWHSVREAIQARLSPCAPPLRPFLLASGEHAGRGSPPVCMAPTVATSGLLAEQPSICRLTDWVPACINASLLACPSCPSPAWQGAPRATCSPACPALPLAPAG